MGPWYFVFMNRAFKSLLVFCIFSSACIGMGIASKYKPISAQQLGERSDTVVLAKVVVAKDTVQNRSQSVTLQPISVLKGKVSQKEITIEIHYGGSKGFDSKLEEGRTGVFFLSTTKGGTYELAFHDSFSLFKPHQFQ